MGNLLTPSTLKFDLEDERSLAFVHAIFDAAWYLGRYPDAVRALDEFASMTALDHYLQVGMDGRTATPFFDADWYLDAYPDVTSSADEKGYRSRAPQRFFAFAHYIQQGVALGYDPTPLFDEEWYAAEHGSLEQNGSYVNHYHHFLAVGAAKGLNPSPLFDEQWFRTRYNDVSDGIEQGLFQSGFHTYVCRPPCAERDPNPYFKVDWYKAAYPAQISEARLTYVSYLCAGSQGGYNPSLHFDESWYRTNHPEVRSAIAEGRQLSGYHHYLYDGAKLDYAPNPYFLPAWYAEWYPQIRESLLSGASKHAFEHYVKLGARQGLSPNLWFDETWYLQNNPDVQAAVAAGQIESGHYHYVETGARENRVCSTIFDADWYRQTYPDVVQFFDQGLVTSSYDHFCRYGRKLSYSPCSDFDERTYRAAYGDVDDAIRAGRWVDGLHHFIAEGLLEGRLPKQRATEDVREQNLAVSELARLELWQFMAGSDRLVFPAVSEPVVSIIMILYNKAELSLRCLRSIQRWVEAPFEIVIVDNASSDSTKALLHRLEGVRAIRNERNLHFLRAANQASEIARGQYLLFLNNDSELQVGAVSSALAIFEEEANIGAVGAKIILNSGVLQEAGSFFLENGFSSQIGRGKAPFHSDFMHRRDVPYCSGAFLVTPASLFAEMGRFDPAFHPAYCEDADYCLRLWKRGLRVTFNPGSIILHHETASSPYRRFLYPAVLRNIAIFRHRYRDYLATLADYGAAPVSSLDGHQMRPAYLVIVENISLARSDARVKSIVARLQAEGLFVTVYPLQPWAGDRVEMGTDFPADVEIVAGKGQDEVKDFCRQRFHLYREAIVVGESVKTADLLAVGQMFSESDPPRLRSASAP